MVQVLCSLCHGSLIEQLLARETQVYLKSLTTLLKTVQTTCLPTTWLPFWRFMPWFFTSKDWTGPSYPLNTTGGQVPAAPLVSCCGGLGLWHPSRSWNPSLVLSSVPRDSVPCPHQSGEGVLWGKGWEWLSREAMPPSLIPEVAIALQGMKASRARRRGNVKGNPDFKGIHQLQFLNPAPLWIYT